MALPQRLVDVAGAIADLAEIDWAAIEAGARGATEREALVHLRMLDRMVRACASVTVAEEAGPPLVARSREDPPPATWGPLTIHERVGHGSFGSVYRAHDRRLDRIVALKLLRTRQRGSDAVASEVIDEGRLLARVHHPNVVTVYGAERIDGRVGMWMEFIEGRTLEEELQASGPLRADAVVEIGLALCGALAAVHHAGLLHRDLKAQNVMRASNGRILLTDFGAGRAVAEIHSDDARVELAGTPLYLAPEVLAGQAASVSSELYGLGVLLYHLATGSFPVRGRTIRALRDAHTNGARVSIRAYGGTLPNSLITLIERAVDPDPSKRFRSVEECGAAFQVVKRPARPGRRVLLAAAMFLLVAIAWQAWMSSRNPALRVLNYVQITTDPRTAALSVLLTDGDKVYHEDERGNVFHTEPVPGGVTSPVFTAPEEFFIVDRSRVRNEYLAVTRKPNTADQELWVLSPESREHRVGDILCKFAAWSHDGTRIAYVREDGLYVANSDATASVKVPMPGQSYADVPRWSPRGDVVRFTLRFRGRPGAEALWEVKGDGTGLRPFLVGWNSPSQESSGDWTPDGQYFIFQSRRDGRTDLWALREQTGLFDWVTRHPIPLTYGPESFTGPVAGQDNRTVFAIGAPSQGQLVRYDLALREFVPYLNGLSATWVSFSPDGKSIAYAGYPDMKLWRANLDGSRRQQLSRGQTENDGVTWSPDGTQIAFRSGTAGRMKIHLVAPDGGQLREMSPDDDKEQGIPTWSPDSRFLAFGDGSRTEPVGNVIHIYDRQSGTSSTQAGSEGLWTARWSPDGHLLSALTVARNQLVILDRMTGRKRPLDVYDVETSTWSADSARIHYHTVGQKRVLGRVRVADGGVEPIADLMRRPLGPASWSSLDADGSPILLFQVGRPEMYALTLNRR